VSRPPAGTDRPLIRRDADGVERTAPSWETLTERLIREAQEAGHFDDLPHRGEPLHLEDDTLSGDMAMAYRVLRNAGAAPPWVEAHKEARRIEAEIDALVGRADRLHSLGRQRARSRLLDLIRSHRTVVERLSILAPTPHQQRRRVDEAHLLARLDGRTERPPEPR
jgi:hypothetical protein